MSLTTPQPYLTVTHTYQEVQLHVAERPVAALTLDEAQRLLANLQTAIAEAREHPCAAAVPAFVEAVFNLLAGTPGISAVMLRDNDADGQIDYVYQHGTFSLIFNVPEAGIQLWQSIPKGMVMTWEKRAEWGLWDYLTSTNGLACAERFVSALLDYLVGSPAIFPAPAPEYPESLTTPVQRALYDLLRDAATVLRLEAAINAVRKDGWRGNVVKEREIKQAIYQTTGHAANQVAVVFEIYRAHAD
ncbi:MAG TPA: hypothetical protein PKH77_19885 [Anaerolineae bacterium]|nr:hypothetical protein [Anaerolineae bacterium]